MTDNCVHRNLIGGEWVGAARTLPNINPSDTSDVIGHFPAGDGGDADAAIQAAHRALPTWRNATPQQRADLLERIGQSLAARSREIGTLLAREEGKTLAEGVGETLRAAQIFKFFAQEALRAGGEALPSVRPGIDVEITREPAGVVGLITPWNFPIAIPAWKIAPALAFGNTVVIKPAELTPACCHVLAGIIMDAGCPNGVFNLVSGSGAIVGQAIAEHPLVNAISFTGSTTVGRGLARTAAEGLKKVQLEMGGKNPAIILADADLDIAVGACINAAFYSTGQRCTATSRIIVERPVLDAFVDRMAAATQALRVGDALADETQIGPVASEGQLASNLDYVGLAREEGAEVIGGERLMLNRNGFYQRPALFLNARNDMRIAREEIFGPCAAIIAVDSFEEALSVANDTAYGLAAGIFTTSLRHAREFKRRSEAGMVMVNLPTAGVDYHVPFGGRKASSLGSREQGRHAVEFYTTIKTAYTCA